MEKALQSSLFGSTTRTSVLLLVRLLEETYPSEVTRILNAKLYSIQTIIDSLEAEGILISRKQGRTRLVTLNKRYVAYKELAALLWTLGKADTNLQKAGAKVRRRPRRAGKPGL